VRKKSITFKKPSQDITMANMEPSEPFAVTIAGFVIPMVTGLLSAFSSGLIIYIISRSQQKLSTTYHRIMTFMSIFDIISSLFIALGTIMMPSDCIFKFSGPLLGNKVSCQAQGWLTTFGLAGGTSLNACLAWYFVCKIVFKLQACNISRYIEPSMYIYTFFIASFVPSYYLSKDLINPSLYDNFCVLVLYPESCDEEEWYDLNKCVWDETLGEYWLAATIVMGLHFGLLAIGMSIILWNVLKTNKRNKNDSRPFDENLEKNTSESKPEVQDKKLLETPNVENSRVMVLQAFMYIAGVILTWIFNLLSVVFNVSNDTMDLFNCILFPLQGFWNLLIFLYDKTYFTRQYDRSVSFWQAVKQMVASPSKVPCVFFSDLTQTLEKTHVESEMKNPIKEVSVDRSNCSYVSTFNNLSANEKSSRKGSGYDRESEVREALSIPEDVEIHAPTNLDLPSIGSSLNLTVLPLHEIRGVQYLGSDNKRFFQSHNGIRRTGEMEDNRPGRVAHNCAAVSIETPKGFVGDSIDLSFDDPQSTSSL
jgi:hypothetical protein